MDDFYLNPQIAFERSVKMKMGRLKRIIPGILLAILVMGMPAMAQELGPEGLAPSSVTAPQGWDDNYLEVGVEWVENYSGTGMASLPATAPDALGLKNQLTGCWWGNWISRFAWGNGAAWEQDFKGYNKSGGGTEYMWADTVDLAYFAGHGGPTGFYFGASSIDDNKLAYQDCRLDWGNGDLEWVGIAACSVLADSHRTDWSWCMNGLHLILGFSTTMSDVPHGYWFGRYICYGYTITQAWFKAADKLQPQGKIARVLAEEYHHFWDRPSDHNASDAMDYATYWYWTHHVGSEPARYVDASQLTEMPVYETPPLSLAEEVWNNLGNAFNVTTTLSTLACATSMQDDIWLSEDGQLEMDPSSGLYAYTNENVLWAEPPAKAAANSMAPHKITQDEAKAIADQFLNNNGLMPADAQFYETLPDTQTAVSPTLGQYGIRSAALGVDEVITDTNSAWQVIYSRVLTYTPPARMGVVQEPIEFSVMGPGAKLKVYVAPEAAAGMLMAETLGADALQELVIGGVGGWRGVGGMQTMAVQETVPILDYAQIELLFEQLEPVVALSYIPTVYDSRDVLSYTLAYYEHPMGTGQDQLIPVYVLNTEYTLANQEVVTSEVYIPSNEQYMAPFAAFTALQPVPDVVAVGQSYAFEAADASATLASLGYDTSLNFALGTGDPDSYLYSWYLNTVSEETRIGTGRTLSYTVKLVGEVHGGAPLIGQTLILEVEDSASPRPPSISYATLQIDIAPPVFLPLVMRN
jgi:hypothetical protein